MRTGTPGCVERVGECVDNPRIHRALRPRVREWILACSPHLAPAQISTLREKGEEGGETRAHGYVGTCMHSIGLWIKEPSSHMAPKRSPYRPLSLSSPSGSPFAAARCSFLLLSLSALLSYPPYDTPSIRHARFNSLMDLCSLITSAYLVLTFRAARCVHARACVCVCLRACVRARARMLIRHNQGPYISPLSGTRVWSRRTLPRSRRWAEKRTERQRFRNSVDWRNIV